MDVANNRAGKGEHETADAGLPIARVGAPAPDDDGGCSDPGPGQVLLRVAGNGLCHSDIGMAQMPASVGELVGWSMPFTLGHEIGGYVEEVGEGAVDTYGQPIAVGAAVALVSPSSCGQCRFCRRGLDSACPNGLAGRGYGRDGGLAPYVVADAARSVLPLTTLDPIAAAPLTDAGSTSYHAVKRALHLLEPGSTAVVLGAGGLGSFADPVPARALAGQGRRRRSAPGPAGLRPRARRRRDFHRRRSA